MSTPGNDMFSLTEIVMTGLDPVIHSLDANPGDHQSAVPLSAVIASRESGAAIQIFGGGHRSARLDCFGSASQ
ncbi:hypothetical protein [Govanella unica]|uniref:Uncharacterized protein n=1 Tax=Govanella unica TaxID=2975056 RepID=A0A9X3TXT1_9PROT|nr:hypothetical protein [Govania unica]MDA5193327.1 hypothetical protein [Govania unica]